MTETHAGFLFRHCSSVSYVELMAPCQWRWSVYVEQGFSNKVGEDSEAQLCRADNLTVPSASDFTDEKKILLTFSHCIISRVRHHLYEIGLSVQCLSYRNIYIYL